MPRTDRRRRPASGSIAIGAGSPQREACSLARHDAPRHRRSSLGPGRMSILVTGGAGYIGSHTVRRLTKEGREVVVLDSMEFGHREAVIEAELVEGDIADNDLVVDLCDRR